MCGQNEPYQECRQHCSRQQSHTISTQSQQVAFALDNTICASSLISYCHPFAQD